jgi:hypothetical protein
MKIWSDNKSPALRPTQSLVKMVRIVSEKDRAESKEDWLNQLGSAV